MVLYAKAVVGAIVAGLGVLLTALTTGDQVVSAGEWVATAIATLTCLGAVYQAPREAKNSDAGYTLVEMAFALLIVVIVLVVLFHFL